MNQTGLFLLVVLAGGGIWSAGAQTPPRPGAAPLLYQFWGGSGFSGSFLGVGVAEINGERARSLNLKEEYGVEITHVDPDSPAEKAGLKSGDAVLEFNGQRVEGIEQFQRLVRETPAGRTVKLVIGRNGTTLSVSAAIGARKARVFQGNVKDLLGREGFEMPEIQVPDMPDIFTTVRSAAIGVEAESLGPQLAAYFGVEKGVLVRSVVKASPAERAGIRAGDILVKVDGIKVASPGEVSNAVRAARSKKSFTVDLTRDRHDVSVTVGLDEDRSERGTAPRVRAIRGAAAKL